MADYGKRVDGGAKGTGFLGPKQRADGRVSTEISIGQQMGGNEVEMPTMVPGLSKAETNTLMTRKDRDPIPQAIADKAMTHAKARIRSGQSPFARNEESPGGSEGRDMGELGKAWTDTFAQKDKK